MNIIGDIGNTEVKICLIDNNYIIKKKINIKTNKLSNLNIKNKLKFLIKSKKNIKLIIFSSVVPEIYKKFSVENIFFGYGSLFFKFYLNKKIIEIKTLKLNTIIDIKVNKKQVGSDRLANSVAAIDKKNNYIIIDFGTATTFDVVIRDKYLGGIISPGINLSLNTLTTRASLIP